MNTIEKIRAEIERLKSNMDDRDPLALNQKAGYLFALADVLSFLDTLEEERPEPYNPVYDEAYLNEKIAKATKSWKGVDVDAMLAECRGYEEKSEKPINLDLEGLDEAAENYGKHKHPLSKIGTEESAEDFKAGAEWQAEQLLKSSPLPEDTVLFNNGVEEGKRLMMEEAVEGEVLQVSEDRSPLILLCLNAEKYKDGDKVRIIIVKEDAK